ncbi:MAG: hypothetical protein L0I24_24345, partial [Pseudonocardia sp.]|nr:hypothetical protein [Pseudonocardia sp.]
MTPEDIKQAVEQALARIAEINGQDVATATDEQLAANQDTVREIIAAAKDLPASPDTVKILTEVKAVKDATAAEVGQRAADLEQVNAEAARLIAEMEDPPAATDKPDSGEGDGDEAGGEAAPAADEQAAEAVEERVSELVASGRDLSRLTTTLAAFTEV